MDIAKGKRVSATEAAQILALPRYAISRIDLAGEIIQRYKLGHKTHVYELESLYRFLASCQSTPLQKPAAVATAERSNASSRGLAFEKPNFSLREFLPKQQTS
ncbi:putative phage integrase domain protein [Paraburkholderia piptadeniae]|uniref:Phage integrase domain protein n=1 Tax=Paraburkholderia piptadeniae TaxID=1701573 RepID=A0A1N7S6I5_9BURK|nr:hypothetical protein [Paraburkholderia piptadeniae]SIT42970.1 putative phage integrase domain protein [Paraburkholderia piptadeniae]